MVFTVNSDAIGEEERVALRKVAIGESSTATSELMLGCRFVLFLACSRVLAASSCSSSVASCFFAAVRVIRARGRWI